ncbi:MAG: biotin transporter BioY [Elusimicrobiota bacterium]
MVELTKKVVGVFTAELAFSRVARQGIGIALFAAGTVIGAYVYIPLPFTPVPVTLQTFFVTLSGAVLGPVNGVVSQICYLMLGCIGLPVFSGAKAGAVWMATGPTVGYLFGFLLASVFNGLILGNGKNVKISTALLTFVLTSSLILICGTVWLVVGMKFTVADAVMKGFVPFIPGDLFKLTLATVVFVTQEQRFRRWFW